MQHVPTGYAHPEYTRSLAEFGTPLELPRSGGRLLGRPVPGANATDACGPYPLFTCRDWSLLGADLEALEGILVSVSLVTDPFGDYRLPELRQCFPDVCRPFKKHFVVELSQSPTAHVTPHHRRYARKASRESKITWCDRPSEYLEDWVRLYDRLIARHDIRGLARFSHRAFARQLAIPGISAFRATRKDVTIGMTLWYAQGSVCYYHLGAYSALGYDVKASFGLFWSALEHFASQGIRWLNLGAGAGTQSDGTDGLSAFKRGWATDTRTVYFCGRILDRETYRELAVASGTGPEEAYFPVYRAGEAA